MMQTTSIKAMGQNRTHLLLQWVFISVPLRHINLQICENVFQINWNIYGNCIFTKQCEEMHYNKWVYILSHILHTSLPNRTAS